MLPYVALYVKKGNCMDIAYIITTSLENNTPEQIILSIDSPKTAYDAFVYIREHHLEHALAKVNRFTYLYKALLSIAKKEKSLFEKPKKIKEVKDGVINKDRWLILAEKDKERLLSELSELKDRNMPLFYEVLSIKDGNGIPLNDKVIAFLLEKNSN